ncbi:hypothetical protein NEOLEDRAFT_1177917 [Neolentinus lepideus HHB14362 ss-1]|uniref:Protein HRI1 n=1 Tax=Neolentinus lepideus HHB14362 ss-1 TaxID=1314782 RepID=A0A165T461_9AGAM|nr:hypothetical protein NEOLEDRAFT_1177917 [Neolentinus lepideus HHB14362 ss-1]
MSKLVATRISLQFPPAPPTEPTDTLVLTFRTHYIDLRILRASLSAPSSPVTVDMGFAGTVAHAAPHHSRWEHVVDSHGSTAVDEGEFTLLPNGDEVEAGTTYNPETSREEEYREVWRQVPVERGAPAYVLESDRGAAKIFAGRIGLYYQAMGQTGAGGRGYSARRWQMEAGVWRLVYEIGEIDLPGPLDVGEVDEGDRLRIGGVVYVVREAYAI